MPAKEANKENDGACPFMAGSCPQGTLQGMQCQYRVSLDFDPVARFNDFQVVYCAVCRSSSASSPFDGSAAERHVRVIGTASQEQH
jgi:hypothetical protein